MPFLMGHVTSWRTRPSAGFNIGAYLTPQQVGVVVLFLVENLTTPVDCRFGGSCR